MSEKEGMTLQVCSTTKNHQIDSDLGSLDCQTTEDVARRQEKSTGIFGYRKKG
jgi:hypothetical protein